MTPAAWIRECLVVCEACQPMRESQSKVASQTFLTYESSAKRPSSYGTDAEHMRYLGTHNWWISFFAKAVSLRPASSANVKHIAAHTRSRHFQDGNSADSISLIRKLDRCLVLPHTDVPNSTALSYYLDGSVARLATGTSADCFIPQSDSALATLHLHSQTSNLFRSPSTE